MNHKHNLVWVDLEMTGLHADQHHILEIAVIITTQELDVVAYGPNIVIHQPESVLNLMDAHVRAMHTSSGLVERVQNSTITLQDAQNQVLAFIQQHCQKGASPLCGNSVWADKAFLMRHMPAITQYLHYRIIDVSTIKELVKYWYPEQPEFTKKKAHRALDDIKESIAELQFYQTKYFI